MRRESFMSHQDIEKDNKSNGNNKKSDENHAEIVETSTFDGLDQSLNMAQLRTRSLHKHQMWVRFITIAAVIASLVIGWTLGARYGGGTGASSSSNTTSSSFNASASSSSKVSIGLQLAPTNLDIRKQSGTALDQLLIGNVYEPLVQRTSTNGVTSGLAKSWTISKDAKTYTFHLNHNMTFSNGDVLNSADVVWSIRTMMTKGYQGSTELSNFESIKAIDANTVRLKLTAPYSELLWALTGRSGLVFDKDANYNAKIQAVGSGPFTVSSYKSGVSVTLKANPSYWDSGSSASSTSSSSHAAQVGTIVIRYYVDTNAAVNALKSGAVQVLAPLSSNLKTSIAKNSRFTVKAGRGTDKYVMAFNNKGSVLSNKKVRQAIRYAIDHNALIASRGNVDKALGGPIPSLDPGYQNLTGLYPYNLKKAKKLLKEAGYDTTNRLTLRLEYANTYSKELGVQLKSQLAKIGIDLQISVVEFSTWLSDVYTNHDYDISIVDHNESHDFYQWADSTYYYGYDNAEVQSLYSQALQASSDSARNVLLAKAARIVSKDAAADWLFNYQVLTAWDKDISGFPVNMNQTYMPLWKVSINE